MRPGSADPADLVLDEDELAGRRADVGDGFPAVAGGPDPEDEVGEGEVGDELPVTDEQVQPLDVVVGQVGPPAQELAQGCHVPSLVSRPTRGVRACTPDGQHVDV